MQIVHKLEVEPIKQTAITDDVCTLEWHGWIFYYM